MMKRNVFRCSMLLLGFLSVPSEGLGGLNPTSNEWARMLRNDISILVIAIQPGYEDLDAIAYFRKVKGARVTCAFVTNGEGGEHDTRGVYPPYLAAERREEATTALAAVNAEPVFLNFPDVPSAGDSIRLRLRWDADSLRARFARLISDTKPDLILLSRDKEVLHPSPRTQVLVSDIGSAIRETAIPMQQPGGTEGISGRWDVLRFAADVGEGGLELPVKKGILPEDVAGTLYSSMQAQRLHWKKTQHTGYRILFPETDAATSLEKGIPPGPTTRLRPLHNAIGALCDAVAQGLESVRLWGRTETVLSAIVTLVDSVDRHIARSHELSPRERRAILHWKGGLENLRSSVLGVHVHFRVDYTAVTELQVIHLTVDSLSGAIAGGSTELFFPMVDQGWAVNEDLDKRFPLSIGQPYRLLSPRTVTHTHPAAEHGLKRARNDVPLTILVIHRAPVRDSSFVYRLQIPVTFVPRFSAEVLTPIVRVIPDEQVHVRLTNNSRDGVRDEIIVSNEWVTSTASEFALGEKGSTHTDSLRLTWKPDLEDGDYLIPVTIGGIQVGAFAARKFRVDVDTSLRIGLLSGSNRSLTLASFHRLGVKVTPVDAREERLPPLDILVMDRRFLTVVPNVQGWRTRAAEFVRRGGHLVVLAQDADAWNDSGIWPELHLTPTFELDEFTSIAVDTSHPWMLGPNEISASDFGDWLFRVGYNRISGPALGSADMPVATAGSTNPLIVSTGRGLGRITYVDLALGWQLLNIHEGAFRILANLVSRSN